MMRSFAICLVLFVIFSLVGCDEGAIDEPVSQQSFFTIEPVETTSETRIVIIVDRETGVQYLFYKHGYGAGLVTLVDAEGKPILYSKAD